MSPSNASYSPPAAAGADPASSPLGRRQYKDHFTHQYAVVSHQTDEGLRSIKRTAAFFEHSVEIQISACEGSVKAMKSVKDKYSDLKDECTHYVNAGLMVEEVMEHTEKTQLVFSQSIMNELVKPMRLWYKASSSRKAAIDKEMNRLHDKLKQNVDDIAKERKACLVAFQELKAAQQQKQQMEAQQQSSTDAYNKLKAKHAKLKETTLKKFQQFEQKLDTARGLQGQYYSKDVPARLVELEAIERERLGYQQECYTKFQGIFTAYTSALKSSSELMQKVLPTLNINKAMNLLFDKWTAAFGPPPAVTPVPYELPCHWTEIQSEVLDSQGGVAAQALNAAPVSPPSAASSGVSYSQPQPAQYGNSYSQPPPPPPAGNDYDEPHNPFAEDAAAASVGRPGAAAAAAGGPPAGGGEAPLFYAEGLFDFELQNDGGDITYVNFKAGDRIAVLQEGDEWWYGEVHGHSGFFPSNYSKRL